MKLAISFLICVFFSLNTSAQGNELVLQKLKEKYGFAKFMGGYYLIQDIKQTGKNNQGVCDLSGKEIISPIYDKINRLYSCDYIVEKDGFAGLISSVGQVIIPCDKYSDISPNINISGQILKYCQVSIKGKKGVIDKNNKLIIQCKYDEIITSDLEDEEYCRTYINGKPGIVRKDGTEMIPWGDYQYIEYYGGEFAIVVKNIDYTLDEHYLISEFKHNGKWGIYDLKHQKEIVPCKYEYIEREEDGIFAFNEGGNLSFGYALYIEDGGKWGYLDYKGNEIIPAQYDKVELFDNGVAQVIKNGVTSLLTHPLKGSSLLIANAGNVIAVDDNIPIVERNSENTFAFIIANENYAYLSGADFSINDGKVFANYCKKTLGLPEKNVRYYEDATYGNMVGAMKKLQDIADVYEGDAKIIFYYSGLGATDERSKEAYLLPSDASLVALGSTGYRLADLLKQTGNLNVENIWVILDAPFSNIDKNGRTLSNNRGIAFKSKPVVPKGNVIVSKACDDVQTAYSAKEYGHGLLTYGLLEIIQKNKGNCTIKDASEYASQWVKKVSIEMFDKKQTPITNVSESIINKWSNIKL